MPVEYALSRRNRAALHTREELGIFEGIRAQPVQAAFSSAGTFTVGAALPLLAAWAVPGRQLIPVVAALSLIFLLVLGGLAAQAGGAPITIGAFRVTFWGALAMGLTAAVGRLFGVVV
ncbi:MAG: VIT1/CCC1 transporter family protein [Thiogranum sp.]